MVVRFSDRLYVRDITPPSSSFSSTSSSSKQPEASTDWRPRDYSRARERYYLPNNHSRRGQMSATSPMQLRPDSLLTTAPPQRYSYEGRATLYDPVADETPVYHQQLQQERPVLQQTAVTKWALPPGYYKQPKPMGRIQRLGESWLFLTCIRTSCLILTLAAIFSCAFSQYWTEKAPVVLGMVFSVLCALVMGAAVSVIFVWDMPNMHLAKRVLFTLIFAILSLTAGVLYTVGVSVCSSYNQYGCFVTNMSPALKMAAAFSYIALVIALLDCGLTFYFYRFDPAVRKTASNANQTVDGRPPLPPSIHTEV
ncbi:hypothetical protein PMAYCL1PPCAC_05568 [Pristionchus mayeri]|uniref:MARVEL domain-containing protein n=1 Tax=Pristionchus mayeri TaxID=1317129 RepID=A0AAN5C361_9BILA|nr:hypothetical protein PMAYCL1PPCAC_05568 [Pristionchus mayeri]